MKTTVHIENKVTCQGCLNWIHKKLAGIKGVYGVKVDVDKNEITIEHTDEVEMAQLMEKLDQMGYKVNI